MFLRFICEQKTFLSFPSFLFLFFHGLFSKSGPQFILFYFFSSCHKQCCLFKFPNLAVILKHNLCFINSTPYPMAYPSHPFMSALLILVLKRDSLHIPNTFSLSLPSLCLLPPALSIYFDQPLRYVASEKPRFFPP